MSRALTVFLVLMALLGLGTVLLVEKFSGDQILPRKLEGFSVTELGQSCLRARRAVIKVWNKMVGEAPDLSSPLSVPDVAAPEKEKKILKWQDDRGVWHYEYAAPGDEAPSPPP